MDIPGSLDRATHSETDEYHSSTENYDHTDFLVPLKFNFDAQGKQG